MRTGLAGYCDAPSLARGCADAAPAAAATANTSIAAAAATLGKVRVNRFNATSSGSISASASAKITACIGHHYPRDVFTSHKAAAYLLPLDRMRSMLIA